MPATTLEPDVRSDTDTVSPRLKHIARMSERRFDGTVETLCGLIRTVKPPRRGAVPCETCVAVRDGISSLDWL